MNSIQPGRRGRRLGRHTAALACAVATALAGGLAGGTGVAHAGTYPMYGCDVPGVHLPTPTSGAWTALDLSGQVQIYEGCPHDPHGQWTFTLNYPTGVLAQQAEVGVVLNIPETGPQSAISISRVIDWSATALTAQSAGQAPATSYT